MPVIVKGDFKELAALVRNLGKLADAPFKTAVMQTIGEETLEMVQRGFQKSIDPYGRPWKPSMTSNRSREMGAPRMKGPGEILRETNRLMSSIRYRASSRNFTVGTNVKYAAIHQYGGGITRAAVVNRHQRSGRFMSKASANRKTRKGPVRVSFTASFTQLHVARPFLPDSRGLPAEWGRRYKDAFVDARKALLGK